MSPSAFLDRASPPTRESVGSVLGAAHGLWTKLIARLAAELGSVTEKWSYSGKTHGWLLQLRVGRRTLMYLVPSPGSFVASFALNDAACQAALRSRLPAGVRSSVERAPAFAEGRAVRLEVRARKDLAAVMALAAIKMAS